MSDSNQLLRVHSIETFGTHDGPGIRLVLFLQGCPFRCVYCHNPDTQPGWTTGSQWYSIPQVLQLLEKQRSYFGSYGGLTVSGGEPTAQADVLIVLFKQAKARGFHLSLDTNGGLYRPEVNQLYDLTDLVILDVKHIDNSWHKKVTGRSNLNVLKNAHYREQSGKKMWLRYVLVPGWTDQEKYLKEWAKFFTSFKTIERIEILPYHTFGVHKYKALKIPYRLENVTLPTKESIIKTKDIFSKYLPHIQVITT